MATPQIAFDDSIIQGKLKPGKDFCAHCSESTWCVEIASVKLPEEIKPTTNLIAFSHQLAVDGSFIGHVRYLGIPCGCYAKFHRQIAHIQSKRRKT